MANKTTWFLKLSIIFCAVFLVFACKGSASAKSSAQGSYSYLSGLSSYWMTVPETGALVIIGVSSRLSKSENEIANAREDAARKAAMYAGLGASFMLEQSIGAGFFDYYSNSEIKLEYDQDLEKYQDKLNFDPDRDVLNSDIGVFIKFRYPAAFPGRIDYGFPKNADGSPEWTSKPPGKINGLTAGVGFARRQMKASDTFAKSYESAICDIVSQFSSVIRTGSTTVNSTSTSFIRQRSIGNLSNFTVLEVWIDPETLSVWTLAVAQNAD